MYGKENSKNQEINHQEKEDAINNNKNNINIEPNNNIKCIINDDVINNNNKNINKDENESKHKNDLNKDKNIENDKEIILINNENYKNEKDKNNKVKNNNDNNDFNDNNYDNKRNKNNENEANPATRLNTNEIIDNYENNIFEEKDDNNKDNKNCINNNNIYNDTKLKNEDNNNKININNKPISDSRNKIFKKNMSKNKTQNIFKNKNKKITIESKNKLDYKSFYDFNSILSPSKTKTIFSVSKSKKSRHKKSKTFKKSNILHLINGSLPVIDKEGLLMEILQIGNEIELMDMEIYKLKRKKKKLEQKFKANKLIIEGILNIQDDNDDNYQNNITENDAYMSQENINEIIDNENKDKEENTINFKTESNYYIYNKNHLISFLKKQILSCDKNIEDKNKLIEVKKNNTVVNNFLKLNSSIDTRNKRLEELVNKSQTLQYVVLDIETRIEYFTVKIKNYIDETIKYNDTIANNNKKVTKMEEEIKSLYLEKEKILKKIKILEEGDKTFNDANKQKKEEKKIVENELKTIEDIKNEKEENEEQIIELNNKEIAIKKNIEKNENLIVGLSKRIEHTKKRIEEYLEEKPSLIEKSKIPKKSRDKRKSLEERIKFIKDDNAEIRKVMNDHNKIKADLIKKINLLSEELKNKTEEYTKIEEELDDIKNEYGDKVPKDYKKLLGINDEENYEDEFNDEKNKDKKDCIIF